MIDPRVGKVKVGFPAESSGVANVGAVEEGAEEEEGEHRGNCRNSCMLAM